MRLAQPGTEGTPHRHRHSGPKSVRRRRKHRGAGFAGGFDRRNAEVVARGVQLNALGRLRAHSHSVVAGGGWERERFLYRCGLIEVGVLYPTAPVGRVMKSVGSNPCQTGHEAITTKLIETNLIGSAHL